MDIIIRNETEILEACIKKIEDACQKATEQQKIVLDYLAGRMAEDVGLAEDFVQDHKSFDRLWKSVVEKARRQAVKGCACVEDATVFEWAEDYIREDDLAKIEAEKKAEAERKAKAEKAAAKRKTSAKTKPAETKKTQAKKPEQAAEVPAPEPKPETQFEQASLFDLLGGGDNAQ